MSLGCKIYSLDQVDSTNTYAMRLAAEGEPEGSVVVAEYQTAGRGRLGRKWVSPRGVNLCMSVILRPDSPPREMPLITLGAGVALARAVAGLYGLDAKLKWPNDLMIGGRKAAGILTEMSAGSDTVRYVVLGVGVNVNTARYHFPEEIRDSSTSIMLELGREVDRQELMHKFLDELGRVYAMLLGGDEVSLLEEWRASSCSIGHEVCVKTQGRLVRGRAAAVDEYGRLLLELPGGGLEKVSSGDLDTFF